MENRQIFSECEKKFLVEIIAKYKHILENKKTDGTTLKEKNETWVRVQELYCSQFSIKSVKQLKKCWDNIKQKRRQINTVMRQSQLLTGGGPPETLKKDAVIEFADAAIPNIDIELGNIWDSTAAFEKENLQPPSNSNESATILLNNVQNTPKTSDIRKHGRTEDNEWPCASSSADNMKKRKQCTCNNQLINLQIQKVEEAIQQQRELHKIRMEAAEAESELATLKLLNVEKDMQDKLN